MKFNNKMFDWQNSGAEPSTDLKQNGFRGGYKPPATVFNNFFSRVTKAITELQEKLNAEETSRTNADNGKANTDLTNVPNDALKTKLETVGGIGGGIPVADATSADGKAYTATIKGITQLTVGMQITIIPKMESTSTQTTLNVNGLGAKNIRQSIGYNTTITVPPATAKWLLQDKPVTLMFDGTYWKTTLPRSDANSLYGTTKIENGGTGANNAADALVNLGAMPLAKTMTTQEYNSLPEKNANTLYMLTDDTTESEVQTHIKDATKHITAEERTNWNAKAEKSKSVNVTLTTAGWSGNTQTVSVSGLGATQNGVVGIAATATQPQREAARAALLSVTAQAAGSLTITADGDKPGVDIPLTVTLVG